MICAADKQRFVDQGYLVIPEVVPEHESTMAIAAIEQYLHVDSGDPSTWYTTTAQGHGIVPLHHHPAFWAIRQLPSIHQAFSQLYGTQSLWVSMDRASFKAPAAGWQGEVFVDPLHWDGDPRRSDPLAIQGLVYLTDTGPDQGAFCCAPGIYTDLDAFLTGQSDDALRRKKPDPGDHDVISVAAPAGSLVVWNRLLPHSSSPNRSDTPRYTQYVTMDPAGSETQRQQRIELFTQKRPPEWAVRQKVKGQQIPETGADTDLTLLGRKLVGLDRW